MLIKIARTLSIAVLLAFTLILRSSTSYAAPLSSTKFELEGPFPGNGVGNVLIAANGDLVVYSKLAITRYNSEMALKAKYDVILPEGDFEDRFFYGTIRGLKEDSAGNIWSISDFLMNNDNTHIVKLNKIDPSGNITQIILPQVVQADDITVSNNGDLWIEASTNPLSQNTSDDTETKAVFIVVDPDSGQIIHTYPIDELGTQKSFYSNNAKDQDGNIWFVSSNITLWNTRPVEVKVGKISASGTVTLYDLPEGYSISRLLSAPDGKIWFIDGTTNPYPQSGPFSSHVGNITYSGDITAYPLEAGIKPSGLGLGPENGIWVGTYKIDPMGEFTLNSVGPSGELSPIELLPNTEAFALITGGDNSYYWVLSANLSTYQSYLYRLGSGPINRPPEPPKTGDIAILALTVSSFLALMLSILLAKKHLNKTAKSNR